MYKATTQVLYSVYFSLNVIILYHNDTDSRQYKAAAWVFMSIVTLYVVYYNTFITPGGEIHLWFLIKPPNAYFALIAFIWVNSMYMMSNVLSLTAKAQPTTAGKLSNKYPYVYLCQDYYHNVEPIKSMKTLFDTRLCLFCYVRKHPWYYLKAPVSPKVIMKRIITTSCHEAINNEQSDYFINHVMVTWPAFSIRDEYSLE